MDEKTEKSGITDIVSKYQLLEEKFWNEISEEDQEKLDDQELNQDDMLTYGNLLRQDRCTKNTAGEIMFLLLGLKPCVIISLLPPVFFSEVVYKSPLREMTVSCKK
jgi:hypothetical protein